MTQLFDYQLLEITYYNRIVYEDGPGSCQNIVSESQHRVLREWHADDESYGEYLLSHRIPNLYIETETEGGRYDYSYWLERRPVGTEQWEFIGSLDPDLYCDYR